MSKMLKQNTQTKEVHGEKTSCYLSERDERKKKKKTRRGGQTA